MDDRFAKLLLDTDSEGDKNKDFRADTIIFLDDSGAEFDTDDEMHCSWPFTEQFDLTTKVQNCEEPIQFYELFMDKEI